MTTRDTRSHIIACKCLLDMGIEKASGDGGAKDGGEVSLEGAREVAVAANAALELQRHSNFTVALELQRQRSNYTTVLELHSSSRTAEAALELHNSSRTAEAALELYRRGRTRKCA